MLYALAFDQVGVVVSDLYHLDPTPAPGQEGPEQGVRLEVRIFERAPLKGSIYSAQPIAVERPIWRADLLESVSNPGSLDRAHHHPRFDGYEPGHRHFVDEMTADPVAWVEKRLANFEDLLDEAGVSSDELDRSDIEAVERAAPEIAEAIHRLLDRVRTGELARPPAAETSDGARVGWL